jgi:hypothetical protein
MTEKRLSTHGDLLPQLRRALEHLAAPAGEQYQYLRGLGMNNADELALEFDDVAAAAESALPDDCRGSLRELNSALAAMSDRSHAAAWSLEALSTAPEWADVRNRATATLRLLPR